MDKQPTILVAFANNPECHLQYLKDEMAGIQSILEKNDISFRRRILYDVSITKIENVIKELDDSIVLFMYSGHADSISIDTIEHPMSAKGLTNQLNKCSNLKLAILNGCNTKGQIKDLGAIGIPAVIATESPVGDWAASKFSQKLFELLFDGIRLENAFDEALKSAESYRKEIKTIKQVGRFLEEANVDNKWILQTDEQKDEQTKNWSVLDEIKKFKNAQIYQPNEKLKDFIYTSLEAQNDEVAENKTYDDAQNVILKLFPQFISKFIYDLCAEPIKNINAGERFDTISIKRIEKCIHFFSAVQEVLMGIVLAEIRECFMDKKQEHLDTSTFVLSENSLKKFNKSDYLKASIEWLKAFQTPFFVSELNGINIEKVIEVAIFFDKLNNKIANNANLHIALLSDLCEKAEDMLIELLRQTLFLINYQFISIKNITVYKNRTNIKARFGFNLAIYEWVTPQKIDGADKVEKQPIEAPPDNFSVLMTCGKNTWKSIEDGKYLNLSPFLIDKNIKYAKSELTHISYINAVSSKGYTYQSLLRQGLPFTISNDRETQVVFNDIHSQFTHFNQLISSKDAK